jgi:ATP-binding cassette subfamily F protein uup
LARLARLPSRWASPRAARKELSRLEREISKLDRREAELHQALAEHATDYARISELDAELRGVLESKEAAEHSWLELSEEL